LITRATHALWVLALGCSVVALSSGVVAANADRLHASTASAKTHGHRPAGQVNHEATILARAAIVDGTEIPVTQAPWQVLVVASYKTSGGATENILCGGAIIDTTHVLTAAHCVFIAPPNERIPPSDFAVVAGTSDFKGPSPEPVAVSSVRAHPYFIYTPDSGRVSPDDIAVLTLQEPLVPSSTVNAITLASLGVYPPGGTALELTGFGEQNPNTKELNGKLYSLGMALEPSQICGGENDAVIICASSLTGSSCSGDSGSALTLPGAIPMLLGVVNSGAVVAGQKCTVGSRHSFANVAAPEIQDFIDGGESPPRAPRGGIAACPEAQPIVGVALTCGAGSWSGEPSVTYIFTSAISGQILQSGPSPEFKPTAAQVGQSVILEVLATNAGGTATYRTAATAPIMAAPVSKTQPPHTSVTLLGKNTATIKKGRTILKLRCAATSTCKGKLTLTTVAITRGRGRSKLPVGIATANFSIRSGSTETITVKVNATGRRLLHSEHGRLKTSVIVLESSPHPSRKYAYTVYLTERKSRS
jgi:hypothetical protein